MHILFKHTTGKYLIFGGFGEEPHLELTEVIEKATITDFKDLKYNPLSDILESCENTIIGKEGDLFVTEDEFTIHEIKITINPIPIK